MGVRKKKGRMERVREGKKENMKEGQIFSYTQVSLETGKKNIERKDTKRSTTFQQKSILVETKK